MENEIKFDYYYGKEAEQFSFYRIPRALVKDERFRGLSSDAKLLYGLMLDRMSLSVKNGWFDDENRAYIHYTLENVMEDLNCSRDKCAKTLKELDNVHGIGLIEKKRQGLGKPDIVYVKNFVLPEDKEKAVSDGDSNTVKNRLQEVRNSDFREDDSETNLAVEVDDTEAECEKDDSNDYYDVDNSFCFENGEGLETSQIHRSLKYGLQEVRKTDFKTSEIQTSRSPQNRLQEVRKTDFKTSEIQTSRSPQNRLQDVRNSDSNYTNINYTNYIQTDYSNTNPIYQSGEPVTEQTDGMDEIEAYKAIIRENLEYDHHMKYDSINDKEMLEEIYNIICDVVCIKTNTVRIAGTDYPHAVVKSRFLKLNYSHVEYVIEKVTKNLGTVNNMRAYLLTALYNAPTNMNIYISQQVQHDMYGGGWDEEINP